jgi:PAS domain S-box-containing protein
MSIAPSYENKRWEEPNILKQAFDCSPENILIVDPRKMKFVDANRTALDSLGYTKEELLVKTPEDIDAVFTSETMAAAFESIIKSREQRATFPTTHKRKDKSTLEVEVYLRCVKENSYNFILVSATERSVLTKAQEELKFYSTLFNNISDAIISVDASYNIISWNKGAENMYGFKYEEVAGKTIFTLWLRSHQYQRKKEVLDILQQTDHWQGEIKHFHKDNSEVWTLVSASVLKDENGVLTGFAVVSKDITDRKKLEIKLQKFNEELEQRVRDKTEEVVSIFDRITDGFIAVDQNWNLTYVNKEAGRIYSKDPNKIIGKNLWEEFPVVVNHPFYDAFQKAMNEQKSVQVSDYYAPFNKWLEGSIYPSTNGLTVYFRDITSTKKSELALKESELRYRTIVETANEGIWQVDENGITTYANSYLATLLGYTREEMIGRDALYFIDDASKEKVLRNREERKKGISSQHELTLVNRKQQTIITLIQSTPLYKEGKYAGSISMLLDITKRKEAEEQLIAKEKRFRALIENSSDGIALMSGEGILLYNSLSGKKITGYGNDEIIDTDRLNYIHPDDRERVKSSLKNLLEKPYDVKKIELRYLVKDGGYKWLECSYSNLLNEASVNAIIVNYRDITEQKNAVKQLQKNEEQLSLIYNNSEAGMWLVNVEEANRFRFETINSAYTSITGKTKEEVIGRLLEDVIPGKNIQYVKRKYVEAVQTGKVVCFFTTALFKRGEITVEIKIIPIKNEAGKVVQLLGTGNNVTEQKKARRELLQMNEQLRELASHLQTIREDERTSIAREIHDELGQQLTVLKMDLSWLNKKLVPRDENIESKLTGSLKLVDSTINTVRKIAAELRPSILDDLGLAEAIEWQSVEFMNRTGIRVSYRYSGKASKFPADISIGLFRIFQESLTNIARHANASRIDCVLENKGNSVCLIIADNGVGFDLNAKVKTKTLGLLGMKERTLMLNGKYDIVSQPGKGTTISVEVPLQLTNVNKE